MVVQMNLSTPLQSAQASKTAATGAKKPEPDATPERIPSKLKNSTYHVLATKEGKFSEFIYHSSKYGKIEVKSAISLTKGDAENRPALKKGDLLVFVDSSDQKIQGSVLIDQNTGKIITNENGTPPLTQVPRDLLEEVLKETARRK